MHGLYEYKNEKVPLEMVTMLLVKSPRTSITTCSQEVTSHVTVFMGKLVLHETLLISGLVLDDYVHYIM